MNPKSLVTLLVWLAVLGALVLIAARAVNYGARKAEAAL